jgi:hypothetical protein
MPGLCRGLARWLPATDARDQRFSGEHHEGQRGEHTARSATREIDFNEVREARPSLSTPTTQKVA